MRELHVSEGVRPARRERHDVIHGRLAESVPTVRIDGSEAKHARPTIATGYVEQAESALDESAQPLRGPAEIGRTPESVVVPDPASRRAVDLLAVYNAERLIAVSACAKEPNAGPRTRAAAASERAVDHAKIR